MLAALKAARELAIHPTMPNGAVIISSKGKIIGRGAISSEYHQKNGCDRVKLGIPTGQSYELCEGCHPKNHSEPKAIADAQKKGFDPSDGALYLWGHWWCCEPCWQAMVAAGIKRVFLLRDAQVLFNKLNPHNIVGRQFEYFSAQLK